MKQELHETIEIPAKVMIVVMETTILTNLILTLMVNIKLMVKVMLMVAVIWHCTIWQNFTRITTIPIIATLVITTILR